MSIRKQIWALPVISTVIFGIGLGVSATYTTRAFSSIQNTGKLDYPALALSKKISDEISGITEDLKSAVTEGDKAKLGPIKDRATKLRAEITKFTAIQGRKVDGDRIQAELSAYMAPAVGAAEIMLGGEGDVAKVVPVMQSTLKTLQNDIAKVNSDAQIHFETGIKTSSDEVTNILYASISAAILVILSLITISFFMIRSIWAKLGGEPEYARSITSSISNGDLTTHINVREGDETSLLSEISRMRDRLKELLGEIKNSSSTIATASAGIAEGNSNLSTRTETQAANIENTSRSIDELAGIVKTNDAYALKASSMAVASAEIATKGGKVVGEVVVTMEEINLSAKRIADITSVIDGIAFQTNILALNAAVEAARAGEQGRGFAVVASEVRNLAQRSASAAKEIKDLINDSVGKVETGTHMVHEAGATMTEIVASIQEVSKVMRDITDASKKQSDGISVVGTNMQEMDRVTQQNANLVEEAASAAASLEAQAKALHEALLFFKI